MRGRGRLLMELAQEHGTSSPSGNSSRRTKSWTDCCTIGLVIYFLTSLIAICGLELGHDFLKAPERPFAKSAEAQYRFANWDGAWYVKIVEEGYAYDSRRPSNVAFFPAYPVLGRWLTQLTGLPTAIALFAISHLSLLCTFVV